MAKITRIIMPLVGVVEQKCASTPLVVNQSPPTIQLICTKCIT